MSRPSVWGFLYALRAAIYIYVVGGKLTPDTGIYAHGGAAWSSPVAALSGFAFGYQGVCMVGVAGAFALGSIVARNSRGIFAPTALGISPPGWYAMEPSADAAGAAASVWSTSRKWRHSYLGILAAFHLEASLVILGARVVGRYLPVRMDVAALGMGVVACFSAHIQRYGTPAFHFQMRYFLPGMALLASQGLSQGFRSSLSDWRSRWVLSWGFSRE